MPTFRKPPEDHMTGHSPPRLWELAGPLHQAPPCKGLVRLLCCWSQLMDSGGIFWPCSIGRAWIQEAPFIPAEAKEACKPDPTCSYITLAILKQVFFTIPQEMGRYTWRRLVKVMSHIKGKPSELAGLTSGPPPHTGFSRIILSERTSSLLWNWPHFRKSARMKGTRHWFPAIFKIHTLAFMGMLSRASSKYI